MTNLKTTATDTLYYEVCIQPSPSGFGEYQRHANSPGTADGYADPNDILSQVQGTWYELGVDQLPEGAEDIRGSIHHEPQRVFAVLGEDGPTYFGIDAVEVICDATTGDPLVAADDPQAEGRLEDLGYAI